MTYYFKPNVLGDPHTILFAKTDKIFEFNFEKEEVTPIYRFKKPLYNQPNQFVTNDDQSIMTVSSSSDGVWIDTVNQVEKDLDELYNIGSILCLSFDLEDRAFYFLCNCLESIIGFYLIKFDERRPENYKFICKWKHKLNIGDANMQIMRGQDEKRVYKELVISYKTIYINTFNVVISDLSAETNNVLLKHEAFQLWESSVSSILLSVSKDLLSFSKSGINLLALGNVEKRPIVDNLG